MLLLLCVMISFAVSFGVSFGMVGVVCGGGHTCVHPRDLGKTIPQELLLLRAIAVGDALVGQCDVYPLGEIADSIPIRLKKRFSLLDGDFLTRCLDLYRDVLLKQSYGFFVVEIVYLQCKERLGL